MPSLISEESVNTSNEEYSACLEEFLSGFKFSLSQISLSATLPKWLCVIIEKDDEEAYKTLNKHSDQVALLEPFKDHSIDANEAIKTSILRYPSRYEAGLRDALKQVQGQLLGLIVSCDLTPWVRHLVYACKALNLRSVLIPKHAFSTAFRFKGFIKPSPWKERFWTVPSNYSEPGIVVDFPVTDTVIAFSKGERRALETLGYPKKRVLLLHPKWSTPRLHQGDGFLDKIPLLSTQTRRTKKTSNRIHRTLTELSQSTLNPFAPHGLKQLFSGSVERQPRAGLVGYHREIDHGTIYVPAMLGFRRLTVPSSIEEAEAVDLFACWGGNQGAHRKERLKRWAKRLHRPMLLVEDGLFRSVQIGLSGTPTLSIMLDDKGAYYDATRSNRLEKLLESTHVFSEEDRKRANWCIRRIVECRLSKYNHAPDHPLPYPPNSVLVVDQRKGDLSVTLGLANENSFREMLLLACQENPSSTVLVKRHPDALSGGKQSYFSNETLAEIGDLPQVRLVDFETNPHALFDCCSKVYVVSSGMGFEALLRGLPVHCFGMPFYAGWGLTVDRVSVPRRTRKRKLEDVFFAACILHSRYYNPKQRRPCTLEDVIEYLKEARDVYQARQTKPHA
jgi:Capsule polysaccharide biosynthesis protein